MEKIALFIEVKYVMVFCLKRCRMMKEGGKRKDITGYQKKRYSVMPSFLLCFAFLNSCLHKSFEQRMWAVWTGLQFRVCLGGNKEWMIFDLDHLYDSAIR